MHAGIEFNGIRKLALVARLQTVHTRLSMILCINIHSTTAAPTHPLDTTHYNHWPCHEPKVSTILKLAKRDASYVGNLDRPIVRPCDLSGNFHIPFRAC